MYVWQLSYWTASKTDDPRDTTARGSRFFRTVGHAVKAVEQLADMANTGLDGGEAILHRVRLGVDAEDGSCPEDLWISWRLTSDRHIDSWRLHEAAK